MLVGLAAQSMQVHNSTTFFVHCNIEKDKLYLSQGWETAPTTIKNKQGLSSNTY